MEISYNEIRSREIVNTHDGKRLGRATDIVFDKDSGRVLGLVVPGAAKIFKKADEIFIPIDRIAKIGEDVILVRLDTDTDDRHNKQNHSKRQPSKYVNKGRAADAGASYVRFRRPSNL